MHNDLIWTAAITVAVFLCAVMAPFVLIASFLAFLLDY